jgi:hypothetical protein
MFVKGLLPLAALVDLITRCQLRRYLGSLPLLYTFLQILQVQDIIDRYCPTKRKVKHGTVAVVLVLNRLVAPRPLYKVADWMAQTVLVHTLGIQAQRFNDDRLNRTLDALCEHKEEIWQEIVHTALMRFDIDPGFVFYDLTAFVVHGEYKGSALADFGFAHNTPSGKRKIKLGINAAGDGNVPLQYETWSGRTADQATVQRNMERLSHLLSEHGYCTEQVLVIGDRACLNDELSIAYEKNGLKYLAGLQPQKKVHKELVSSPARRVLRRYPLNSCKGSKGYWGMPCRVNFEHKGKRATHRGLIVLSGPMCKALRQARATRLRTLRTELQKVRAGIGQPRCRTVKQVQARAETRLRNSPAGKLMRVEAFEHNGCVDLRWWVDRTALLRAMHLDGRYLLVTNAPLSPAKMLERYRAKDGVEKRFLVTKQDLKVSPIYLHKDNRIEAMLLVHMIALLVYSLLEREVQKRGLQVTTRRIIEQLGSISLIETHCWDGSVLYRLTPVNEEQHGLLRALDQILCPLQLPIQPLLPAVHGGQVPKVAAMEIVPPLLPAG